MVVWNCIIVIRDIRETSITISLSLSLSLLWHSLPLEYYRNPQDVYNFEYKRISILLLPYA